MHQLIVYFPDGNNLTYEIASPSVTVGRAEHNDIAIAHESVAEEQLRISLDVTGYVIVDLAGDGTTALNDYPIETGSSYQLENGMCIRLGELEAVYSGPEVEQTEEGAAEEGTPEPEPLALPGSFPRPVHPPGVFVAKKAHLNLWMVGSVGVAALVLLGTAFLLLQVTGVLGEAS